MQLYKGLGRKTKEVERLLKIIAQRVDYLLEKKNNDGLLAQIKTASNAKELGETYKLLFGKEYTFTTPTTKKELMDTIDDAEVLEETKHEDLGSEVDSTDEPETDSVEAESVEGTEKPKSVKNPFASPVVDRSDYTQGDTQAQGSDTIIDNIPEPDKPDFELPPEPTSLGGDKKNEPAKPFANPALKEADADVKRKAAKVAAGALMAAFKKFQDKPFKYFSKMGITEDALTKAALAGELDIDELLQVGENTVIQVKAFFANVEAKIDNGFVLDEDTEKEIHSALIDVLMEQSIGMTPTQRLIVALGGWAVQQISQVVAFRREISGAMEVIKDNYKGKMEVEREKLELQRETNRLAAETLKLEKEKMKANTQEKAKETKAVKEKNDKNEKGK